MCSTSPWGVFAGTLILTDGRLVFRPAPTRGSARGFDVCLPDLRHRSVVRSRVAGLPIGPRVLELRIWSDERVQVIIDAVDDWLAALQGACLAPAKRRTLAEELALLDGGEPLRSLMACASGY